MTLEQPLIAPIATSSEHEQKPTIGHCCPGKADGPSKVAEC